MGYVTYVERWIGHLLGTLERLNLQDETTVMFLLDHGTQIWDKGKFGKGGDKLYPFNTQLNWFVQHPDGPRGHHSAAWVQNQDLTPTILKMMDIEYNAMDGVDVWPIALGARDGRGNTSPQDGHRISM